MHAKRTRGRPPLDPAGPPHRFTVSFAADDIAFLASIAPRDRSGRPILAAAVRQLVSAARQAAEDR